MSEKSKGAPAVLGAGHRAGASIIRYFKDNWGILAALFVIGIFLQFYTNGIFLGTKNVMNVLRQVSINANLACGLTMIIILGGIDLSVGSGVALAGVITGGLIAFNGWAIFPACLVGIVVVTLIGAFNGLVISRTFIPPFVVTLATMNIARGAAYVYTNGQPIRIMDEAFTQIGMGYLGSLPLPVIYSTVFLIVTAFILSKTRLGRHIYAVGGNREAARFAGIKINRVLQFAYTFSGFMAGVSGVVLAARMFSGQPTAGEGAEMDAIAATVLGGTSMMGGSGRIGGTLIGVLIIGVLSNGLNLMNVNSFWQYIVKGVVILLAVYVDVLKNNKKVKK